VENFQLKSGEQLIVRNAAIDDAGKFIEYLNQISTESEYLTFGAGEVSSVEQKKRFTEDSMRFDNSLFIIAEIDGNIVGSLLFRGGTNPRVRHTGEFGVSVIKEYWGLGIAAILIKHLINWAKETIIRKINLRVRDDNENAIYLYDKLGFKKEGIIARDFLCKGRYYSSIMMGLEIN
jgi:RimJ/RimL family protein N-acetyltransferase